LRKLISDDKIRRCVSLLREKGIQVSTTNMLGLPDETYEEALATIRFNRDLKVDRAWFILFVPFPKTVLGDAVITSGKILDGWEEKLVRINPHDRSLLRQEGIRSIEILHKFCYLVFRYPWIEGIVGKISKGPFLRLYHAVYRITFYLIYYSQTRRLSLREFARTVYYVLSEKL